jgi:hypothetical protein
LRLWDRKGANGRDWEDHNHDIAGDIQSCIGKI